MKKFPVYRENFVHMNATYSIFSRLAGKPSHMNKTKLFGESKCFLPNRDYVFPYEHTLKTSGLNLTQIGSNRSPDPGQYATDANRVKLTQTPGSTYLTQNSGSIF